MPKAARARLELVRRVELLCARGLPVTPACAALGLARATCYRRRPHARRLPKGQTPLGPGSLVQLDTLYISLQPGTSIKHFTAYCLSALQVDGGAEFMAAFETACATKGLELFVLPPKSPKLNGAVERANGSWRYEFYALHDLPDRLAELNPLIDSF